MKVEWFRKLENGDEEASHLAMGSVMKVWWNSNRLYNELKVESTATMGKLPSTMTRWPVIDIPTLC